MSTVATPFPVHREPELLGQTVVVIGGSSGIGFETARRARAEGAALVAKLETSRISWKFFLTKKPSGN